MISRKKLTEFLEDRMKYEDVDIIMVDELFFNLKLLDEAKKDVDENGLKSAGDKDGIIWHQSSSLKTYNTAFKNIMDISKRLGLSPRDRKEIGSIGDDDGKDAFND